MLDCGGLPGFARGFHHPLGVDRKALNDPGRDEKQRVAQGCGGKIAAVSLHHGTGESAQGRVVDQGSQCGIEILPTRLAEVFRAALALISLHGYELHVLNVHPAQEPYLVLAEKAVQGRNDLGTRKRMDIVELHHDIQRRPPFDLETIEQDASLEETLSHASLIGVRAQAFLLPSQSSGNSGPDELGEGKQVRTTQGAAKACREAAGKISVQGCPDDTPEPVRDIAATFTVGHLRRLEGHHGLAALEAFDDPALGIHHGLNAHLMNYPRGLKPTPGGDETVLAQIDDRSPYAQLSRLAGEQLDLGYAGMNGLAPGFQGAGLGGLSPIGHRETIALHARARRASWLRERRRAIQHQRRICCTLAPGKVLIGARMSHDAKDSDAPHGWEPLLSDLEERQRRARAMGGSEKLEKARARGQLNARERIETLLDPGSFQELGALVGAIGEGAPADAFPAGMGRIEGRPVLVGAEDFSVMGGSIGLGAADKRYRLTQLARDERVPLVFILHGAGHRITNALKGHGRSPNDLQGLVDLAGIVPTVCVVAGPAAGHSALAAPLMDFSIMTEQSALFSAGPPLVEAAVGEKVSKEELGGPEIQVIESGVAHNAASDDMAALALARRYLGYFPANAWQRPPRISGDDTGERSIPEILSLVPSDDRKPYAMAKVVSRIVDEGSLLEIQPHFGASLLTAFARLGGQAVAVVANNPNVRAGAIDREAADKGARFIEIAGSFHFPVIFLADNPGVMPGTAAERSGALRAAARMFAAQRRLRGAKLHVTLRKAFGFGSSIMGMNPFDGQTLSVAFPGATLGAMPARGGGIASKSDDDQQAQLDAAELGGPYRVADSMAFDDIIDPREVRNVLLRGLALSSNRQAESPGPLPRLGALP